MRANASSESVSSIAAEAVAIEWIESGALVRNGHTDALVVEVGSAGAFQALSSVPGSAQKIISAIERIGVDLTDSTIQDVATIARKAGSGAFAPS